MVVPEAEVSAPPAKTTEPEPTPSRLTQRLRQSSAEEAEAAYVAARDAWTAAMKAANSGRPADLASLAIAQEAYEAAVVERERWMKSEPVPRTAIPIEGGGTKAPRELDAVVNQELGWRHVHDPKPARGIRGLFRKILGD